MPFSKIQKLSDSSFALFSDGTANQRDSATLGRGSFTYNSEAGTLVTGSGDAVCVIPLPEDVQFCAGVEYTFRAFDLETGNPKDQVKSRTVKFAENEKRPGVLVVSGSPKSPKKYPDYIIRTMKFRAYYTHTGVDTSGNPSEWTEDGPMAWLLNYRRASRAIQIAVPAACRDARRACFAPFQEELHAFRDDVLLPTLKAFNDSLGRSKDKIKFPRNISRTHLDLSTFMRFSGYLKHLSRGEHPTPEGLVEKVDALIAKHKGDKDLYNPINEFQRNFKDRFASVVSNITTPILPNQAKMFEASYQTVFHNRKKMGFDKGWPLPRYEDRFPDADWRITGHVNSAGQSIHKVLGKTGYAGLRLGPAVAPQDSNHPDMRGRASSKRWLRQATITYPNTNFTFSFAVLQSEEFPEGECFLKEWRVVEKKGKLWLCLCVEEPPTVAAVGTSTDSAGIDFGWRVLRKGDLSDDPGYKWQDGDVQVAALQPASGAPSRPIIINLERSYGKSSDNPLPAGIDPADADAVSRFYNQRQPFVAKLGPSRWGRYMRSRNVADQGAATTEQIQSFIDELGDGSLTITHATERVRHFLAFSEGYAPADTFRGIMEMQSRRSALVDLMREFAKLSLRDDAPSWIDRVGSNGLAKLHAEPKVGEALAAILQRWQRIDKIFGGYYTEFWSRVVGRRNKEYERIAHSILRAVTDAGVHVLRMEEDFLASTIAQTDKYSDTALRNSQRYRQWAGLNTLRAILKHLARYYRVEVIEVEAAGTTTTCSVCGTQNEVGVKKCFECVGCGVCHDQDGNSAKVIAAKPSKRNKREVAA